MTQKTSLKRALDVSVLKPPPTLTVSEWADEYRFLSSESSAAPGRWYGHTAPYLKGIMEAFTDATVETVVVMSSAQIGKTEVLLNVIGYVITQDPCPMMMIQPTTAIAEAFVKDRLIPMLRDTPALKGTVDLSKRRDRTVLDTMLHRTFKGGHLTLAGANSPASLSARPIRNLLLDEVDRYPLMLKSEGDVVNLARKRTTAFFNKKIGMVSTPTVKGASRIESEYESSDQRHYFVPCPHCSEYQVLQFGSRGDDFGLKWDNKDPNTAFYMCAYCHEHITHGQKQRMLLQGEWRATADTSNPKIRGFHVNELYSPFVSWAQLVQDFLSSKDNPETLRTFINTSLGEPFDEVALEAKPEDIQARAEEYDGVPDPVRVLTCGVDIQGNRIEAEVVGWGPHMESWGIERVVIDGDPLQPPIWEQLEKYLDGRFKYADGRKISISCTCIDSGFATDQVYTFVRSRGVKRIFAVKGMAGMGRQLVGRPLRAKGLSRSVRVFPVGVDAAKDSLFANLKCEEEGTPRIHFPLSYSDEFYSQLVAEKPVVKLKSGVPVRMYVKVAERNEAIDIRVYARAALELLKLNLDDMETPFGLVAAAKPPPEPEKPKTKTNPVLQEIERLMRTPQSGGFVNRWKK